MADKKKPKPEDRHKSGFMVRLPESFRLPLQALKRKTRRDMTVEVQIALEKHFQAEGVPGPQDTPT